MYQPELVRKHSANHHVLTCTMPATEMDRGTTEKPEEARARRPHVLPSKEALSDETVVKRCLAGEKGEDKRAHTERMSKNTTRHSF